MDAARTASLPTLVLAAAALLPVPDHALAAPARPVARKAPVPAGLPTGLVRLQIAPGAVMLDGPQARQRLVVTATAADGATHDVTDHAAFTTGAAKPVRLEDGVLTPAADGEARLTARLGSLTSGTVTVTVRNSGAPASTEFVNDVMPLLSKAGCNSTACHGSPAGKGGFKLSLFGYEPDLDHRAITQEQSGKRVDLKEPLKSLLLQKPTLSVPHAGGQRFKSDGPEHRTLLAWLKEGAPAIGEFEARVRSVEVLPAESWMPAPGAKQRLVVLARMSDGSSRDVTDRALFSSSDDAIADVDGGGVVSAKRAGETAVMVRYLGQVAVSRVAVLPPWKLEPYPAVPKANYVDEQVQAKLRKLRLVPSAPCTDEEFIRRATLDVCGIIPTPEEVKAFAADADPKKREKLVDSLLARPEFVDLWTMKWNDVLRNNPRVTRNGLADYSEWVREQVRTDRPYDQFVRDLLTASGSPVRLDAALAQREQPGQAPAQPVLRPVAANPKQARKLQEKLKELQATDPKKAAILAARLRLLGVQAADALPARPAPAADPKQLQRLQERLKELQATDPKKAAVLAARLKRLAPPGAAAVLKGRKRRGEPEPETPAFNPAASYYVVSKDPLDVTSATSQIFLGVRIECARCHNHPFEKWTQNDYYGLAAFFQGVTARGSKKIAQIVRFNPSAPPLRHPKTNEAVEPKTLDNLEVRPGLGDDRRAAVAAWITAPENPWFAKALVNRLWAHYFGKGIIDPIDDVRATNPASNPALLEALAKDFTAGKFDVKRMHRVILTSATYGQSSRPNRYNVGDTRNFARCYPRRLMAEQLYDSISQATGVFLGEGGRGRRGRKPPAGGGRYNAGVPAGATRVMQAPTRIIAGNARPDGVAQFLDTFGKPRRASVCECERSSDGNIGQALALINGDEVNDKITAPAGRVQELLRSGKTDAELIGELYLAALSRKPTPQEREEAASLIRSAKSRDEGAQDLMWGLLNSREFLFNH